MFETYKDTRYINSKETVTSDNSTHILNFDYLQENYTLPSKLSIYTRPKWVNNGNNGGVKIYEQMKKEVEVFKFIGVNDADALAVLRIWAFKNSGDGYAHSQKEIDDAGRFYKEHLIDKKEGYVSNYFTGKNK